MAEFLQTIGALFAVFGVMIGLMLAGLFLMLRSGWRERDKQMDGIIRFFESHPLPLVWAEKDGVEGWYDPHDHEIMVIPMRGSMSPESN